MLRYPGSGLIYTGKIWKAKCKVCPATRFGWTCLCRSRIRFLLAGKRVGVDPDGFVGGGSGHQLGSGPIFPLLPIFWQLTKFMKVRCTADSRTCSCLVSHDFRKFKCRRYDLLSFFVGANLEEPAAFSLGGMSCMSRQPRGLWTTMDTKWAPEFAAQGPRVC